jgi:hypothetical protein
MLENNHDKNSKFNPKQQISSHIYNYSNIKTLANRKTRIKTQNLIQSNQISSYNYNHSNINTLAKLLTI